MFKRIGSASNKFFRNKNQFVKLSVAISMIFFVCGVMLIFYPAIKDAVIVGKLANAQMPSVGTLRMVLTVDNTGGGWATASSWSCNITANGNAFYTYGGTTPIYSYPFTASSGGVLVDIPVGVTYGHFGCSWPRDYIQTCLNASPANGCDGPMTVAGATCTACATYVPTYMIVRVNVVGGTAVPANFTGSIGGAAPYFSFTGSSAGVTAPQSIMHTSFIPVGGWNIMSMSGPANYTPTYSSDCNSTHQIVVGSTHTCTITETYVPPRTLTASVSGGNGSITPTSGSYSNGTVVTLTATPNINYHVASWSGTNNDGSTATTNTVTMNSNKTVTVSFAPNAVNYNLVASVSGGHGSVTPASGSYSSGTNVGLTASPDPGYQVASWSGTDNDSSTANANTVTMSSNKTVAVTFELIPVIPSTGNVSGFAWSSNIGWISFNSNDCDNNGTIYSGTPAGCPSGNPYRSYAVSIDNDTGNFSGYAWSSNIGWISFNRCGTDNNCSTNDGDTGNPPNSPTNDPGSGTGPIAKVELDYASPNYGQITGWAKILAVGEDGWIRFDHSSGSSGPFPIPFPFDDIDVDDSGTTFPLPFPFDDIDLVAGSGSSDANAKIDINTGIFSGWAWNGNDNGTGIGWISFNCADDSGCSHDYKVKALLNRKPTIALMQAPAVNYCNHPARTASLLWSYDDPDGDPQSAYQVIFREGATVLLDTGKCSAVDSDCIIIPSATSYPVSTIRNLSYGTTYNWSIIVWDSHNAQSLTYNSGDFVPSATFKVPDNEYPDPYFTWYPNKPSAGEEVRFVDKSFYYPSATPSTRVNCDESTCSVRWEFSNGVIVPDASSTITTFANVGNISATSTVTDSNGGHSYSCSTSTAGFTTKRKLPTWIETK